MMSERIADIALLLPTGSIVVDGIADMASDGTDVVSDAGLQTAVLLSLFTDARAASDDVPPGGVDGDRRGYWADQFAVIEGDRFGSRAWILERSKRTPQTARLEEEYAREALAWMIEDRVVASVDIVIEDQPRGRLMHVTLHRPGRDPLSFRFAHTWDAMT